MAESRTPPTALLVLANLGRPRRPAGATIARGEPILPDPLAAAAQLAEVIDQPVTAAELAPLRRAQRAATRAAEAILAGDPLDCAEINTLASASTARAELVSGAGPPRRRLVWTDPSSAAALARRLIDELAALEPDRLRRCARPQCSLLFYDTTKSRTRRWHAEDPCGRRERRAAYRARCSQDRTTGPRVRGR